MSAAKKIKAKTCPEKQPGCHGSFYQFNSLQKTCINPKCALAHGRKREEKKARKKQREERSWIRQQKEALKTKPQLIAEAQTAFNTYIRTRDAQPRPGYPNGLPCITCGGYPRDTFTGGSFDCGHFRSVGACPELRFDEDNAHRQCTQCNKFKGGDPVKYEENLILRIGEKRVARLKKYHPMPNYTHDYLRKLRDHYRTEARRIQKEGIQ